MKILWFILDVIAFTLMILITVGVWLEAVDFSKTSYKFYFSMLTFFIFLDMIKSRLKERLKRLQKQKEELSSA